MNGFSCCLSNTFMQVILFNINHLFTSNIGLGVRVFANGPSHTKDSKNGT